MNTKLDTDTIPSSKACTCGKSPDGLCGCATGAGCGCSSKGGSSGCGGCSKKSNCGCSSGKNKLEVFDWLWELPEAHNNTQMVEVQFKNTRKGYYLNSNNIELYKGDLVAVEATPGHDIGEVTLTGKLVLLQMKKVNYRPLQGEHKRVYRIAKPSDLEKRDEAKAKEHATMLRARELAEELGLAMKISDVEYQGDGNKAIFYYIADERVDFRQLIKIYAEKFRVKIEMKQIGARQEAGRVGGIGPCGRELCCSGSVSSFVSVSTSAARYQDISLNPQKLAGQCGKLKCCLNYEVDTYVEAQRQLPSREIILDTKDNTYYHFKTDILSGMMTYSTDKHFAANTITVDKNRVFDVIQMNKRGRKPLNLASDEENVDEKPVSNDILAQENINRFDNSKKKKKKSPRNNNGNEGGGNGKIIMKNNNANVNAAANSSSETAPKTVNSNPNRGEREESGNNNNRSSRNNNNRRKPNVRPENREPRPEGGDNNAENRNKEPKGEHRERRDNRNNNNNKNRRQSNNNADGGEAPKRENPNNERNKDSSNNEA